MSHEGVPIGGPIGILTERIGFQSGIKCTLYLPIGIVASTPSVRQLIIILTSFHSVPSGIIFTTL